MCLVMGKIYPYYLFLSLASHLRASKKMLLCTTQVIFSALVNYVTNMQVSRSNDYA